MRLQIYVLRELFLNFFFTATVLGLMSFLTASAMATYQIPEAPPFIIFGYVRLVIMYIFPYLLPISLLIGVILTSGRLAAENEITAMRAGGVHLWTVLGPTLLLGLGLALVNYPLVTEVIPGFSSKKRTYIKEIVPLLLENLPPNRREISFGDFRLVWQSRTGPRFNLVYLKYRNNEEDRVYRIQAEQAQIKVEEDALVIFLWKPQNFSNTDEGSLALNFDKLVRRIPLDDLRGNSLYARTRAADTSSRELAIQLKRGVAQYPRRATFEIHKRIATVFSGLLFALIGVPIAIFMHKGNRLSAFTAAFMAVMGGYYPIVYLMEVMGKEQKIQPILGAWMPNVALGLIALILVRRLFRS